MANTVFLVSGLKVTEEGEGTHISWGNLRARNNLDTDLILQEL